MGTISEQLIVAIDVGGTSMKGAIVDCEGQIFGDVNTQPTKSLGTETTDEVVDSIAGFANRLLDTARVEGRDRTVAAIGLAVPGIVHEEQGLAQIALNVGWQDVAMADSVEHRTATRTVLAHDVRAGGLAESVWGAGRSYDDHLFIAIGTGLGAAVMLRGEPYVQPRGVAGELGHMTINAEGIDCSCGRQGCLEAYASGRAIGRRYTRRSNSDQLASGKDVLHKVKAGDRLATQVWNEAISALAIGIMNCILLLDPDLVVIGGGVAQAGDLLFSPLNRLVAERVPTFYRQPLPAIVPARFGTAAGLVGAAAHAWLALGMTRAELVPSAQ